MLGEQRGTTPAPVSPQGELRGKLSMAAERGKSARQEHCERAALTLHAVDLYAPAVRFRDGAGDAQPEP